MMDTTNTNCSASLRKAPPKRTLFNPFYRKAVPRQQQKQDDNDKEWQSIRKAASFLGILYFDITNQEDK